MNINETKLKIITFETRDSLANYPIVTPSVFASTFSNIAKKHKVEIENESDLAYDIITQECSRLDKMQENTSKNAQELSNNTNRAINAIKTKDEKLLQSVLKETELLRREIEKLKESIYKDELTYLYNRKWLHDKYIDKDTQKLSTSGHLALLDLNYFKLINDTHGHIVGDKVLIYLAKQFQKSAHPAVRYGGDEFLLLFNADISLQSAKKEIDALREDIVNKKLKAHDNTFSISFSYGLASFHEGDFLSDIIDLADKNMYQDKGFIKEKIKGI